MSVTIAHINEAVVSTGTDGSGAREPIKRRMAVTTGNVRPIGPNLELLQGASITITAATERMTAFTEILVRARGASARQILIQLTMGTVTPQFGLDGNASPTEGEFSIRGSAAAAVSPYVANNIITVIQISNPAASAGTAYVDGFVAGPAAT